MSLSDLHNNLVSDPNDGGLKDARDEDSKIIISDSTFFHSCHINSKKCMHVTRSCVVVNVAFLLKLYIHYCYLGVIGIWKKSRIKAKMIKVECLVRKHITYIQHIKTQWCHMGVIFMPNNIIWQMKKCALILIWVMHFHTGNVYYGAVPTVLVLIFLIKKQIKNMTKLHPLLGFTFITSLEIVQLMGNFHLKTIKYVTCVNKNLQQINIQNYTPEKN